MSRRALPLQRGAGLQEFAIAVAIISALGYVLLRGLDRLQEVAERKTFEQTVEHIETALRYEATSRFARGQPGRRDLLDGNPVRWLQTPPAGYLGELPGRLADGGRRGVWYFDQGVGQLVYRPLRHDRFRSDPAVGVEIRLQVVALGTDGRTFKLRPARPYTWD